MVKAKSNRDQGSVGFKLNAVLNIFKLLFFWPRYLKKEAWGGVYPSITFGGDLVYPYE